ncbi:surface carbohydrate biosynthesis protein [Dongia soli]|uniref:Surface carbohydrate biosynthesis protein n=1 Tax=Dongia soli TaxID=600628 RepID=A0ABU5EBD4_9PROT|nr:surface carbohydrate biosynthesis protein [Dongia soli]MDY0883192.1 hypothetical protein [Dongia soli]
MVAPQPILYMPMEIASRELDSRLLLATLAVARGYEVVLGQKWLIERNIERMPPGLYLSKTLTQRDGLTMAKAKSLGYLVAAIDEELPGLFMSSSQLRWMSQEAVDATDLLFVAGDGNSAAVAERFPTATSRIVQAANPRWDLLRADLRDIYADEVSELRRRYGRFILINTNLGFTNCEKGDVATIIRDQERLGKLDLKNPDHAAYVQSIISMEEANRAAIEALLKELPSRFPNHRIILRPHPSEALEVWKKIGAEHPQIEVIREGPAVVWIMAADLLIHTNCTTGVEALALDKPAICLMPSDSPANERYLSNRVNPIGRNVREALDLAAKVLQPNGHKFYTDDMLSLFRQAMSYDQSKLGAETILNSISSRLAPISKPSVMTLWRPKTRYRWCIRDKNVRGILMPQLDEVAIRNKLATFARLLHVKPPAYVSEAGSKVLLVSNSQLPLGTRCRRALGWLI